MCFFMDHGATILGAMAQAKHEQRMADLHRRQADHDRWANSRTPYQDELQAQLQRMQNQWMQGCFEHRRFYCAGQTWEALIWVEHAHMQ